MGNFDIHKLYSKKNIYLAAVYIQLCLYVSSMSGILLDVFPNKNWSDRLLWTARNMKIAKQI